MFSVAKGILFRLQLVKIQSMAQWIAPNMQLKHAKEEQVGISTIKV